MQSGTPDVVPEPVRSADALVYKAVVTPGLLDAIQRDPLSTLQRLASEVVRDVPQTRPVDTDIMLYRIVVGALGAVTLVAALGVIVLSLYGRPIPETLAALGSGAVGCLGGLLAPSPVRK